MDGRGRSSGLPRGQVSVEGWVAADSRAERKEVLPGGPNLLKATF